jgi:hypothetical protein
MKNGEKFQKELISKLSKFEDRVVYLHFYDKGNQTGQHDMKTTIELIHTAIDFLDDEDLSETNINILRQLNEKYIEYKDWFKRTNKTGHNVSELWNI